MPDKNLTELLEQLHDELDNTKAVDEKGRQLLRSLNTDIEELLDRSKDVESDDSLLERLQESIDYFEATHPKLTTALSQMLNILNNEGI